MKIEALPVLETTRRDAGVLGSCEQRKFMPAPTWTEAMLAALQTGVKGGKWHIPIWLEDTEFPRGDCSFFSKEKLQKSKAFWLLEAMTSHPVHSLFSLNGYSSCHARFCAFYPWPQRG